MDLPIACSLSEDGQKKRQQSIRQMFTTMHVAVSELPDGYRYTFATTAGQSFTPVAEIIDLERECCPFLSFHIAVEPEHAVLRVEVTGPTGAKPLIENFFGSQEDTAPDDMTCC